MGLKTALYDTHILQGAKIVDFGGWEMPLHYGSQIEEHHAVRRDAGMFDVSHMGVVDLSGDRVRDFLRRLLANDVGRLTIPGKALYSCMLLPGGGVIDDLIVYFISDTRFRVVVNAGTRDKDLAWISRHAADFAVTVALQRDLAMIAIQGPNARDKTLPLLAPALRDSARALAPFFGARFRFVVRRADRLHRRGRLRGDAAGRRSRQDVERAARTGNSTRGAWAPETRCGWKPA